MPPIGFVCPALGHSFFLCLLMAARGASEALLAPRGGGGGPIALGDRSSHRLDRRDIPQVTIMQKQIDPSDHQLAGNVTEGTVLEFGDPGEQVMHAWRNIYQYLFGLFFRNIDHIKIIAEKFSE